MPRSWSSSERELTSPHGLLRTIGPCGVTRGTGDGSHTGDGVPGNPSPRGSDVITSSNRGGSRCGEAACAPPKSAAPSADPQCALARLSAPRGIAVRRHAAFQSLSMTLSRAACFCVELRPRAITSRRQPLHVSVTSNPALILQGRTASARTGIIRTRQAASSRCSARSRLARDSFGDVDRDGVAGREGFLQGVIELLVEVLGRVLGKLAIGLVLRGLLSSSVGCFSFGFIGGAPVAAVRAVEATPARRSRSGAAPGSSPA
jgi:hypothetical protein